MSYLQQAKEAVLREMEDKYGEWLEMAGDNKKDILIDVLLKTVVEDRLRSQSMPALPIDVKIKRWRVRV